MSTPGESRSPRQTASRTSAPRSGETLRGGRLPSRSCQTREPMAIAAGLLVSGMVSFMIGAAIPLAWLEKPGLVPEVWSAPLERYLQLIAQHRRSWAWTNCFMIAAVVLNGAGLAALAGFAGQPAVTAGAAGYGIAAV